MEDSKIQVSPWREGCDACDHNLQVIRRGKGSVKANPYPLDSQEYKEWRQGYEYRSMVNDG